MFTVLSWFCFIGAALLSPALLDLKTAGFNGLKSFERSQVLGFGTVALTGLFFGYQGIANDERGRSWARLGMIMNGLALAAGFYCYWRA